MDLLFLLNRTPKVLYFFDIRFFTGYDKFISSNCFGKEGAVD